MQKEFTSGRNINADIKFILLTVTLIVSLITAFAQKSSGREIIFCGEKIPVDNEIVAKQLMDIIRRQIPGVNLPDLRKRVEKYFPIVEYYLRETGLPDDLKYVAIVESGFRNLTSHAGARGFWQLMGPTAHGYGLDTVPPNDERDDIRKATYAACKHFASYYMQIRREYGISSWVLTAAAYNYGIGNMFKNINRQGKDYFSMKLNPETAVYVYKIIAVKELFENPELYMKDFGYNVFNSGAKALTAVQRDTSAFKSMELQVVQNDGRHPDQVEVVELKTIDAATLKAKSSGNTSTGSFIYFLGEIQGKYQQFKDGTPVSIELLENLEVKGDFTRKGNVLRAKGWLIGDRVFLDLGYEDKDLALTDMNGEKGIPISLLKNKQAVVIRLRTGG